MTKSAGFIPPKFNNTLGSDEWLETNKEKILELFPTDWTHIQNLNPLEIGFKLKLLGVEWNTEMEFGFVMMFLVEKGFANHDEKNKYLVKRTSDFKLIVSNKPDETFIA